MDRATKITCPSCLAPLKSVRGIRFGKKITCPKCQIGFTVCAEDAEQAESEAGSNESRLAIVLVGSLIYFLSGAGLAVYCFHDNNPRAVVANVGSDNKNPSDDADNAGTAVLPPAPALPKPSRVSPEDQRKIDRAIADGVWFLKDRARPDGTWGDSAAGVSNLQVAYASLPALTLLECGVPATDAAIQNAAKLVRNQAREANVHTTYQLSLAILFLDRLEEYRNRQERDRDLIQHLALRLVAGQRAVGGWTYDCPTVGVKMVPKLLAMLADPRQSLAAWHEAAGSPYPAGGWDNSNTQFAILALWVAQRHGVAIDKPIGLVEEHFRKTQLHGKNGAAIGDPMGNNANLDGSWRYDTTVNSSAWPSMTCAGLLGLAIGHGVTKDPKEKNQKPLDDAAIKAALTMLAREIDRSEEKRAPDLYFLWSVQRVGVLYDLDLIDGKDWYGWGYKKLLPGQKNDGSWTAGAYYGNNPILNTCFALLFLKRANLARDLTEKLQLLARLTGIAAPNSPPPAKKD